MSKEAKKKVIFMGSDGIALPALEVLHKHPEVSLVAIYTQPDRPSGRGKKLSFNAIKSFALTHSIPVFQPEKLNADARTTLLALAPDLLIVMAYGHILKKSLLDAIPLGTWNLHTSLLPKFRGASPIQSAIAAGESETGVTLMQIEPRMDAGAIVAQKRTVISTAETGATLYEKLSVLSGEILHEALPSLLHGTVTLTPQSEEAATYCQKLSKEDAWLDFHKDAATLSYQIRAFQPWPGACCAYGDEHPVTIKIGSAQVAAHAAIAETPGTIIQASPKGIFVSCANSVLELLTLQRPGGKMLPAPDFLNGFPLREGQMFSPRL